MALKCSSKRDVGGCRGRHDPLRGYQETEAVGTANQALHVERLGLLAGHAVEPVQDHEPVPLAIQQVEKREHSLLRCSRLLYPSASLRHDRGGQFGFRGDTAAHPDPDSEFRRMPFTPMRVDLRRKRGLALPAWRAQHNGLDTIPRPQRLQNRAELMVLHTERGRTLRVGIHGGLQRVGTRAFYLSRGIAGYAIEVPKHHCCRREQESGHADRYNRLSPVSRTHHIQDGVGLSQVADEARERRERDKRHAAHERRQAGAAERSGRSH